MHEIMVTPNLAELAFYVLLYPANGQNRLEGQTYLKNTPCLVTFQEAR